MPQEVHPTYIGKEQNRCSVCHRHGAVQTDSSGELVFDSYQALVEAVKIWNHEEKRQEVCRYIKETAGQYPNHRGMKKKLMDLMPETPFEGEPMAVTREPNDMEKSLL